MCHRMAFTLVEILVLITIIVLLLALLAPALDKAIYQAELAVCGANLRAVAGGASQYAFDHSRRYPYRQTIDDGDHIRPDYLAVNAVGTAGAVSFDDRPILRNYIALNAMLNCPLSRAVNLEVDDPTRQTFVYTNYALWFGFRFGRTNNPQPGMRKVGDRFAWGGNRFDVLADDSDSIDTGNWVGTAHPDQDGLLSPEVWDHELNAPYYVTFSFWTNRNDATRGPVDRNFAHQDNSVRRINDLEIDDVRMVPVPDRSSTTGWTGVPGQGRRRWLPRAQ
jgi:competence protein ComGC